MNDEKENKFEVEYVPSSTDKVMCDGGNEELGHPTVYFKIDKNQEVVCNYCNKKFIKKD
tara:strand:+ start:1876 stop:2052 length:177 start_codon:yes stop_codon:yes gene_type:complete